MGTLYFTSDLHFNHRSILKYTDRGQDLSELVGSVEEEHMSPQEAMRHHNEWIINTLNRRVTNTDHLYILGDVAFGSQWEAAAMLDTMNGHKHLVLGNHDSAMIDFYKSSGLFESVTMYAEVVFNKKRIILFHYPIAEWNSGHHSSWHLHGHTHANFDYAKADLANKRILDVGWDNSKKVLGSYGPFSFEQVEKYMEGRVSIEHHGNAD
jgi:calcineurin-like phosphoesterase family protein